MKHFDISAYKMVDVIEFFYITRADNNWETNEPTTIKVEYALVQPLDNNEPAYIARRESLYIPQYDVED